MSNLTPSSQSYNFSNGLPHNTFESRRAQPAATAVLISRLSSLDYICFNLPIASGRIDRVKHVKTNHTIVFERKPNSANVKREQDAKQVKIDGLEVKLQQKNEVIAELLQERVQLKKVIGEP